MNNSLLVVVLTCFLFQTPLLSQKANVNSNALSWSAESRGTGQVCNEIAIVRFKNSSTSTLSFESNSYFVPSDGKHQAYLIPHHEAFEINPNDKVKIPFEGFCLDYNLPPAKDKKLMTPFNKWVKLSNASEFEAEKSIYVVNYEYLNTENVVTNISDKLLNERKTILIPRSQMNEVLPVVLDAFQKLEKTINFMYLNSDFKTVFSMDPDREKTILLQHSLWLYISTLTGQKYDKPYFKEKLIEQLEDITQKKFTKLPQSMVEDFEIKVDELWNYFYTACYEAGIIAPRKDE